MIVALFPVWLCPDPARQAARMRQERRRANNRRYYEKNRERMKARARAWDAANPERRREINREWARAIGKEFGVSYSTARQVCTGSSWAHIQS